jgi:FlaA1/EpsC-like NDP-sugar epimerase
MGQSKTLLQSIDNDVVQRIAKAADFTVLMAAALLFSTVLSKPGYPEAAGFFALIVTLSCLLAMRGLGLYQPRNWVNGLNAALTSAATAILCGGALFALAHATPLAPSPKWLLLWCALCAAYFLATRLAGQLWARPAAQSGRLKTRIAIVGGGQAAEDALKLLEHPRPGPRSDRPV